MIGRKCQNPEVEVRCLIPEVSQVQEKLIMRIWEAARQMLMRKIQENSILTMRGAIRVQIMSRGT